MWFELGFRTQYRFEEIYDPSRFFDSIETLLPTGSVLVLGCYEAKDVFHHFLMEKQIPEASTQHYEELMSTFRIYADVYPKGGAFHLTPSSEILERISGFARDIEDSSELCDHLAAYNPDHPTFIFHDAFTGGNFWVSPVIPKDNVERFSEAIGIPFEFVDIPWAF